MEGRGLPRQFSQWRAFINERSVLPQQHPNRHCQLNWPLSMKANNRDSLQRLQKAVDWLATGRVANQNAELHSVSLHMVKRSGGKCETRYKKMNYNLVFLSFISCISMSQHIA